MHTNTEKTLGSLLKINNWESSKHLVLFRNDTSGTTILNTNLINPIQLNEAGILLEMPIKTCQTKHAVAIYIYSAPLKIPIKNAEELENKSNSYFVALGKVKDIQVNEMSKDRIFVEITYTQYEEKKWQEFINYYIRQQQELNQLFLVAKGK